MIITLSTQTFDLQGYVEITPSNGTQFPVLERRVTRTATLDGNNTINDSGLSESDGVFEIETDHISVSNRLEYLIKNYTLVVLSSHIGVFIGVIKRLDTQNFPLSFTFLASKKLN